MNRRRYDARNIEGLRVVSCPDGLWQCQKRQNITGSRERDPWIGLHRPTDLETAKRQFATASHGQKPGELTNDGSNQ
jgi:hypothetical protein